MLLLNAASSNRRSILEHLDLSNNLIACGRSARCCMDAYQAPNIDIVPTLTLNLVGCSLTRPYPEVSEYVNRGIELS